MNVAAERHGDHRAEHVRHVAHDPDARPGRDQRPLGNRPVVIQAHASIAIEIVRTRRTIPRHRRLASRPCRQAIGPTPPSQGSRGIANPPRLREGLSASRRPGDAFCRTS